MSDTRSELAAEQVQALYQFLSQAGHTEGGFVDTDLRYRWVTDTLCGVAAEEVRGQTSADVFDSDIAELLTDIQQRALTTGERVEQTANFVHADRPVRYQFVAEPVSEAADATAGVMLAVVDLSQQFQYLERTTDAVFTVDPDWTITYWGDRMAERTEMPADEVIGENYWELFGDLIPSAVEERYRRVMQTGEPEEFETYLDDPFDYWAEARVFGDKSGLSIYSREITARKQHEHQLEAQRDAFQILNQLLRHDIRNDLQVAMGYLNLLADSLDDEAREHAATVRSSLEHATELTVTAQQMADTISQDAGELHQLRLDRVLEGEIDAVREAYPEAVVLTEDALPAATVRADTLLDSVFRNLLKNAIQHNDKTPPEVTVTLGLDDATATVTIADNGPGIPADMQETLFSHGAKGASSTGTGVGLYLVDTLVDNYNGEVTVKDNNPTGTRISVTLPLAQEQSS